MAEMVIGARYLIVLMAIFSIYIGLLYNDIFSLPIGYSGSGYKWYSDKEYAANNATSIFPLYFDHTYGFGIDPVTDIFYYRLGDLLRINCFF